MHATCQILKHCIFINFYIACQISTTLVLHIKILNSIHRSVHRVRMAYLCIHDNASVASLTVACMSTRTKISDFLKLEIQTIFTNSECFLSMHAFNQYFVTAILRFFFKIHCSYCWPLFNQETVLLLVQVIMQIRYFISSYHTKSVLLLLLVDLQVVYMVKFSYFTIHILQQRYFYFTPFNKPYIYFLKLCKIAATFCYNHQLMSLTMYIEQY